MSYISIPLTYYHIFLTLSFYFNYTTTTEIYTLSLHDALPIYTLQVIRDPADIVLDRFPHLQIVSAENNVGTDRKSTRLNSSHVSISYAVFCLKKKNKIVEKVFRCIYYQFCSAVYSFLFFLL